MPILWEQQMEREMEERYSEWKQKEMDRTIESFDEHPLTLDWTWQAYERDYPKRTEVNSTLVASVCFFCIGLAGLICVVNYVSKVVAR